MGRSVSYLNNAICKAYFNLDMDEYDEYVWEDLIEGIQNYIVSKHPDFSPCNRWEGREDHIILEGYGCIIAISEYCGLCCLSVASEKDENESSNVATWVETFWPDMVAPWNKYRSVGIFSNGEQIFERIGG